MSPDVSNVNVEEENYEQNANEGKQPILPFSKKKGSKIPSDNFKLPPINFLKTNPDIKNKKNIDDSELTKNSEFLEKILLDFGVEG